MLDYAANATRYWPADRIRSLAAQQAGGVEQLDQRIRELIGEDADDVAVEAYWTRVDENLRSGQVRLLFVADELPRELRRVIEFLNEHMPKIEVLGVEVRHYASPTMRALVPRVVGQTERARDVKDPAGTPRKTSEEPFLDACPEWTRGLYSEILAATRAEGLVIKWGTKGFSIGAVRPDGTPARILYGNPPSASRADVPFLDVYLKELVDSDDPSALRSTLIGIGGFEERGQYTVRLPLTNELQLTRARTALPHIWALYRQVRGLTIPGEMSRP